MRVCVAFLAVVASTISLSHSLSLSFSLSLAAFTQVRGPLLARAAAPLGQLPEDHIVLALAKLQRVCAVVVDGRSHVVKQAAPCWMFPPVEVRIGKEGYR